MVLFSNAINHATFLSTVQHWNLYNIICYTFTVNLGGLQETISWGEQIDRSLRPTIVEKNLAIISGHYFCSFEALEITASEIRGVHYGV